MQLSLSPEMEKFIEQQVKLGHYPNREAVVRAALEELRDASSIVVDDKLVDILHEADDQAARGEGMELDDFRSKISKRFNQT